MRLYLPLLPGDLVSEMVPIRPGAVSVESRNLGGDEQELAEDQALYEAAFSALELLHHDDVVAPRIVAVAEGDMHAGELAWEDIQSFHVDDDEGIDLIAQIKSIDNQGDLDYLVDQLMDVNPLWYDASELNFLRNKYANHQGENQTHKSS